MPNEDAEPTPLAWWNLTTQQKLRRLLWTSPIALGALAFYLFAIAHVPWQRALLVFGGAIVLQVAFVALYVWRLREERAAVAREGSTSVLAPVVAPRDGRSGFVALGLIAGASGFVGFSVAGGRLVGGDGDALFGGFIILALAGVSVVPALYFLGRGVLSPASTAASRGAAVLAAALLVYMGWNTTISARGLLDAQRAAKELTRRGHPIVALPAGWARQWIPSAPGTSAIRFSPPDGSMQVSAVRENDLAADADDATCLRELGAMRDGLLRDASIASVGSLSPSTERRNPRELCRATVAVARHDGATLAGTLGALACPHRGGSVLYISISAHDPPPVDAATVLGCLDDPPPPTTEHGGG